MKRFGRCSLFYGGALVAAIWCLSCLQLFSNVNTTSVLDLVHRQLLGKSCKTPYVVGHDVFFNMPKVVPPSERNTPSHVQLCQAFLEKKELADDGAPEEETAHAVVVKEDPALCSDWATPHQSIMKMFASSLIAKVGESFGLEYKHNCYRQLPQTHSSKKVRFDYTPAQVVLPQNLVSSSDAAKVDKELLAELCTGCIDEFHDTEKEESEADQSHHCLLFPSSVTPESVIEKSQSKLLPLAAILPSMVDIFRHFSLDWIHTTDPIELEDKSGVIVYIDEHSTFMNYNSYDHIIPKETTTSVQILISASCALAQIQKKSDCVENGRRLKRYFVQNLTSTKGIYVRLDIVASTAAAYARMNHAKLTIIPPGSLALIPALTKNPDTQVYIAEHPDRPSTRFWYDHLLEEHKKTRVVDLVSPNEVMKEEVRINSVDMDILDNVDVTMPLSVIGEDTNGRPSKLTEKEEEGLLASLVQNGEVEFDQKLIRTPLTNFGYSPGEQEDVLMEIPFPDKAA